MKPVWTLEDGLSFVRMLRLVLLPVGWGVGLGGSVLYRWWSNKDIDIILFPLGREDGMQASKPIAEVWAALVSAGLVQTADCETVQAGWKQNYGSNDDKHVEVWDFGGRRVDLFFLR